MILRNHPKIIANPIAVLLLVGSQLGFGFFTANAFAPATTRSPEILDLSSVGSLSVPNVGCGTIAWSTEVTGRPTPDLEELISVAQSQGGSLFDTGERYGSHMKTALGMGWGETECLVKKLLRNEADIIGSTSKPIVATKFTPSPARTTVQSVVEACEKSKERLGVETIDLYQIQMPDIVKPMRFLGFDKTFDEVYWDGLAECYHRGLVKNVGVSNYGPTLVSECHEHLAKRGVPLASNQIAFSLIGRHNGEQETLDRCNELGVKVLAYYPFAMGLLTGKYTAASTGTSADSMVVNSHSLSTSRRSVFERQDLERYANGDGKLIPKGGVTPLLRTMEKIANIHDVTVAQVALNYIICKGAIPIPGARTAAQYVDNMGALGWRLTEQEIFELENEADDLGFSFDGAGFKRSNAKFVGYGMERWSLE
mmetsp:Transcript_17134/g.26051  ORF Transcript_17134/g.26051 Transcript_17134/m.26051 type:complete len:425 (-) Transcript_17134:66-1340(-)|eukprot:CAMPEP_0196130498 /NCGR_PEP_ID=MMETSP0910-20130528/845_1 /TAXON_ID=49265 /ORGANISM="Thalassiosira rotula, Strain GSO102" /LENGTH=424 /DNA_ID=CAMNT_0041389811 /DNA_START=182 /DNA_END=1456 /DNA_ORIENTATION=-